VNFLWLHPQDGAGYRSIKAFIADRIWGGRGQTTDGTIIAVAEDDKVIAAVIFHNYDQDAGVIEMTGAADNPRFMSRRFLREVFGYIFDQMRCQLVVMRVDPENRRMCSIAQRYGFARYDIPRLRGRDKGEAIFLLTEEAWRGNRVLKEQ
jgi:RimJ/RimL family protein N-acetyltransferase